MNPELHVKHIATVLMTGKLISQSFTEFTFYTSNLLNTAVKISELAFTGKIYFSPVKRF